MSIWEALCFYWGVLMAGGGGGEKAGVRGKLIIFRSPFIILSSMFADRLGVDKKLRETEKDTSPGKRNNRVFILEYSPDRPHSKKQKKWEMPESTLEETRHRWLQRESYGEKSGASLRQSKQSEGEMRSGIDRLRNLILSSRSGIPSNDTGCQKLVRILQQLLRRRNYVGQCFEAMKRYAMNASSTNYELFLQSRHQNYLKDTVKMAEHRLAAPVLEQIAENWNNEDINQSNQTSRHASSSGLPQDLARIEDNNVLKKGEMDNSITFQRLESPRKGFESLKWNFTKNNIATRADLSDSNLDELISRSPKREEVGQKSEKIDPKARLELLLLKSRGIEVNVEQKHLDIEPSIKPQESSSKGLQQQVKNQMQVSVKQPSLIMKESEELIDDVKQAMNTIEKQASKLESQKSEKSDKSQKIQKERVEEIVKKSAERDFPYSFATSIAPVSDSSLSKQSSQKKIKINYGIPVAESSKTIQNAQKKPAKKLILNSAQLADRMLFGVETKKTETVPVPAVAEKTVAPQVVSSNNRKRIMSLPKITFTYTSREKDGRLDNNSPAFKNIIANQAQKIVAASNKQTSANVRPSPVVKVQSKKLVKKQLQSTFGSTQLNDNSNQDYMMHVKSAKELPRAYDMPNQRERVGMNPFTQRPHMPVIVSPRGQQPTGFGKHPNKIDNEYYGQINSQRAKAVRPPPPSRERILTSSNYPNQIQYIGVEGGVQACCWQRKEGRSKSLNDKILIGLVGRAPGVF